MTRHRTRAAWVLPSLLAILLSGCGADKDSTTVQEPRIATAKSPTTQPDPSEIVGAVEVTPKDLPRKYGTQNRFGESGDQVEGQVSLDLCGAQFTSEGLRTARHQVGYGGPGFAVSSETVAYEAEGAELAMSELRDAIANCPQGFYDSKVAGQASLKTRLTELPSRPDWQEETLAMRIRLTTGDGRSLSGALIYQRRGDVLTAAYVWGTPKTSAELASQVASLLSARLDASVAASS